MTRRDILDALDSSMRRSLAWPDLVYQLFVDRSGRVPIASPVGELLALCEAMVLDGTLERLTYLGGHGWRVPGFGVPPAGGAR